MKISEITNKWSGIGFLDNCKHKEQLSRILETTAEVMLSGELTLENKDMVETTIFSVVIKLYNDRRMSFDRIEIKQLIKKLDKKSLMIKDLHVSHISSLEIECEFISFFCQNYEK